MTRITTSIKAKTFVLSFLIPLLLIIILTGSLFVVQFNRDYENAQIQLLNESRSIRDRITIEFSESLELLRNLSVNPMAGRFVRRMDQVPNGLDNDDYQDLDEFSDLRLLMQRVSRGTKSDLVYTTGLATTGLVLSKEVQIVEGFDVRKRDYFQGALADPATHVISEPRVSAEKTASGEPKIVITAARAVIDDSAEPLGIVALNYSFDPIISLIRSLMDEYNVKIMLYDTVGRYVLWNESDERTYFFNPEEILPLSMIGQAMGMDGQAAADMVDKIASEQEYYLEGGNSSDDQMIQFIHIPETRWAVSVSYPKSRVYRRVILSVLPPILIFLVVFLAVQIAVYLLYSRLIVKPLRNISEYLERLAESDADLTVAIPTKSKDEIGQVAQSFNKFVEKLRSLMIGVKTAMQSTDSVKLSVSSATEETSSSIEQISANLKSIGSQLEILDENIDGNVAAIEEVTHNISSVDEQIMNQSAMVEESTASITQMIASLNSVSSVAHAKREVTQILLEVADDGKRQIEDTKNVFKTVVQYINQIQEMATTISSIAGQTNLLSMNAAIESAHAGDAGRGFAVVAEEIRKLADSAGQSSQTIAKLISDVTKSVMETDNKVESTSKAFDRISQEVVDTVNAFAEIENSVAELNTGGQQILESSNQINLATSNIRDGSKEIKSGTILMSESSGKIREASQRVTAGMSESLVGSQEIVTSMQRIVGLTQELDAIVEELKDSFGQLKTE